MLLTRIFLTLYIAHVIFQSDSTDMYKENRTKQNLWGCNFVGVKIFNLKSNTCK